MFPCSYYVLDGELKVLPKLPRAASEQYQGSLPVRSERDQSEAAIDTDQLSDPLDVPSDAGSRPTAQEQGLIGGRAC